MKKLKNNWSIVEDIVDLENKLILANKRASLWRKLARQYRFDSHMEAERVNKWMNTAGERQQENYGLVAFYNNELDKVERKQKKAWIAFYIATILYIVGIMIIIWQ